MMRNILLPLVLVNIFSCTPAAKNQHNTHANTDTLTTNFSQPNFSHSTPNIHFDFTAKRILKEDNVIEVFCSLFNDGDKPFYFLSSTCSGIEFLLEYDTAKIDLDKYMNCNASYPIIETIAPHQSYEFESHFKSVGKQTNIKLGFHLQPVTDYVDLMKTDSGDIKNWLLGEEHVIWASEKNIE